MKWLLILAVLLVACSGPDIPTEPTNHVQQIPEEIPPEVEAMKLESNFEHNSDMPRELTCQGEDLSPHLKWSGVPKETKSFALRIFDPDAPGDGWVHWQVYNIPRASTGFEKGTYEGSQVPNDFGKEDYGGPCPPSGKHKYVHTLYALDVEELEDVTKDNFLEKIGAHTIDKAELIGLYEKS